MNQSSKWLVVKEMPIFRGEPEQLVLFPKRQHVWHGKGKESPQAREQERIGNQMMFLLNLHDDMKLGSGKGTILCRQSTRTWSCTG